jgi:hypothetical protein
VYFCTQQIESFKSTYYDLVLLGFQGYIMKCNFVSVFFLCIITFIITFRNITDIHNKYLYFKYPTCIIERWDHLKVQIHIRVLNLSRF